jgi:predicted small lipoprotein YifL
MGMHRGLKALVLLALAATLALGGCGRRGALESPGSAANSTQPEAAPVDPAAPPADTATEKPPRKGFFLDPLI